MLRWTLGLALMTLCATGCAELGVEPFQGSWIALSLNWPLFVPPQMAGQTPQPSLLSPGEHLDMWAILPPDGRPVRLTVNKYTDPGKFPGFNVVPALDPNDPCLIDANGNHLLGIVAQSGPDKELQQQAVVQKVREVVAKTTTIGAAAGVAGKAPVPLLGLVQDGGLKPDDILNLAKLSVQGDAQAIQDRLAFCPSFLSSHFDYYQGNPLQLTAPLHGTLFGFFNFNTIGPEFQTADPATFLPPQNFGGIAITTRMSLHGMTALLLTRETAQNPALPGTVVVKGGALPPAASGRGAIRFGLQATIPVGMGMTQTVTVGTASVLTDLDQGID